MRQVINKNNKLNFALTILSELIFVALGITLSFIMKLLTEAVEYQDGYLINLGSKLAIVYFVGFIIASRLRRKYYSKYIEVGLIQIKEYIFEKVLSKSISDFEYSNVSNIVSGLSNDMNVIENNYLFSRSEIIYNCFIVIFASIALLYFNFHYGMAIILTFLTLLILSLRGGNKLKEEELKTSDSNEDFIRQVSDVLNGFVVIKSFGAEENLMRILKQQNIELENVKRAKRQKQQDINLNSNVASMILNMVSFVLGFSYAFKGEITFGTVMGSVMLANTLMGPIRNLGPLLSNFKSASGLMDKLEKDLESESSSTQKHQEDKKPLTTINDISVNNLSFSYGDKVALNDISFNFKNNKKYAIVGLSGSGKTTLLELLLGYNRNYEGKISYGDLELREISLASLYEEISVLQQDVFLFDSSLKNNITMFNDYDQTDIYNAIEEAGLESLVSEKGLDYKVGESGENLSGGEKQRISIARTLIRKSPIIFTDEATSSLDNKTAQAVGKAILNIPDTTLISITHRYNREILEEYDCIIALKDGKIEETGSFEELMDNKDYFYSLFTLSS